MRCDSCHQKMQKVDRRTELAELDDEATDGQMADYLAAEESGDYGAWGIGIVEYECRRCNRIFQVMTDELQSYDPLILGWHEKAKEGDYFSRFVFEYLAFCALLKNKLFIAIDSDRRAIQALKRDEGRKKTYLAAIAGDEALFKLWQAVINELGQMPLLNSSRDLDHPEIDAWWNNTSDDIARAENAPKGVVLSLADWGNMVEFWYGIRNNLFHGGKSPTIQRDCFLVEHAYLTLRAFVAAEIAGMA